MSVMDELAWLQESARKMALERIGHFGDQIYERHG